ncbi:WD repeat-containing protein 6 [Mugil cephalus]|uniref:WD repeat-containing protein 6 n=1 Tax=Mugil cephalus TaxID=48193 RepID=UPI001FB66E33|nr:WD repeat-containing protein 6 [Mugil cephalus]
MEPVALVAPVTALEFLQDTFLLTGEGPVLSVYSLQPRPKACASLSVLQQYRIHGIRPKSQPAQSSATDVSRRQDGPSSTAEPKFSDLAVFGGKAVRLVRLRADLQQLEIVGPLMELQDWALDVRWLSGDNRSLLCVAVAHNSALLLDAVTGNALVRGSCLEGCLLYSALLLVHESWADTVLVGGTVFNQLIIWKPGGGDKSRDSEHKAPVERRLLGHSGVIFSISYLQEKGYLASASDDRSVRVWGVGALGGAGGKCGDVNAACLRVLYGHQARVFSVRLSPGKVFSAGEDGACLVWDWAGGGKVVRTLKGHRAGGVRGLAVSEGTGDEDRWVATGGADGGVRLWRVEGGEEKNEEEEEEVTEKLTDLNFSTDQGAPKVVCLAGEEDKNTSWSQSEVVVCTDKGKVCQYSQGKWETIWEGTPEFQSYCVMETVTVGVKESADRVHLCAVGSLTGSLQVFPISRPQSGTLLSCGSGKIHSLIWLKGKEGVHLLASGAEGLVYRWRLDVKLDGNCSVVLSVDPLPPFLLPPCAKRWLTAAVGLRSRFRERLWVCGDRRGSLLLFQDAEKSEQEKSDGEVHGVRLQPVSCLFGVHGKQGVTSVCEYQGLLYSTGRDGCVRVFRVQESGRSAENKDGLQLEVLRVQRACKGMEWLERILILEPEAPLEEVEEDEEDEVREESEAKQNNLTETLGGEQRESCGEAENRGREARFAIVGFHAVHFVVWDPVKQERLLAVPCGGGHRSWSLWPSHKGVWPGYGALVFIKQGSVLASQPPGEELGWATKAGRTGGWGLREGVHGRGIGCVCRLGAIEEPGNEVQTKSTAEQTETRVKRSKLHWEVMVTGGEDTSLTVLAVRPSSGSVKVLSVITDHISSVRTVTAVTRPERETLSALLVSAGGRAQIQCYRLLVVWDGRLQAPSCQVIQVASHRLDDQWERKRNRHKTVKMDPETRYMSVAVVDEKSDRVLLALSCSDGAVRLFSVSEVKCRIDLLWETFHHQRCVLSVATCSLEDDEGNRYTLLFSAATDGKIAAWDLTEALAFWSDNSCGATPPPTPCLNIPAHQSGVNSLAVWSKKLGQQEGGGCLVTVVSGGDDGRLTASTVRVLYPEESQTLLQTQLQHPKQLQLHLRSQSHVALAHAAPLTALKLLRPGLVVSTSSDQRVCLWKVCSAGISHSAALCCHVADASGLAAWEGGHERGATRSECEREISVWGGLTTEGETGGRFNEDKEPDDEAEGGEPVGSETGDPVIKTCDEDGAAETSGDPRSQTETDSLGETGSEVNGTSESRKRREETGWVLVCGQGFQLLRVRTEERGKTGKEKMNQRVKVTFHNK